MKLIIVRHSISEANVNYTISGANDDPDLSARGIELAKKVAQYVDPGQIDEVYTPDLNRTIETAKILVKDKNKIHIDNRLQEMNFGSWDGQDDRPLHKNYPDAFDFEGMIGENYIKYAKNGESFNSLTDRCDQFLNDLKKSSSDKTILIVSHGFAIRGLIAASLGIEPQKVTAVKNVSFTEIAFNEKDNFRPRLMSFNREKPAYYAILK